MFFSVTTLRVRLPLAIPIYQPSYHPHGPFSYRQCDLVAYLLHDDPEIFLKIKKQHSICSVVCVRPGSSHLQIFEQNFRQRLNQERKTKKSCDSHNWTRLTVDLISNLKTWAS